MTALLWGASTLARVRWPVPISSRHVVSPMRSNACSSSDAVPAPNAASWRATTASTVLVMTRGVITASMTALLRP